MSVVGNALGMLPQILAVAFGVGALVAESILLFTIIKFAGAAYLIYLGIQAIRHRNASSGAVAAHATTSQRRILRILREGFLVGATNPKSIVFFVAVLPQFVDQSAGAVPLQLATLGVIFLTVALISDSVWALVAGTARAWLARNPRRLSRLSATGGAMMIGVGGTLALTGNKN